MMPYVYYWMNLCKDSNAKPIKHFEQSSEQHTPNLGLLETLPFQFLGSIPKYTVQFLFKL